jgi:hypothetical protein
VHVDVILPLQTTRCRNITLPYYTFTFVYRSYKRADCLDRWSVCLVLEDCLRFVMQLDGAGQHFRVCSSVRFFDGFTQTDYAVGHQKYNTGMCDAVLFLNCLGSYSQFKTCLPNEKLPFEIYCRFSSWFHKLQSSLY